MQTVFLPKIHGLPFHSLLFSLPVVHNYLGVDLRKKIQVEFEHVEKKTEY